LPSLKSSNCVTQLQNPYKIHSYSDWIVFDQATGNHNRVKLTPKINHRSIN
jgi:hypothetical protein